MRHDDEQNKVFLDFERAAILYYTMSRFQRDRLKKRDEEKVQQIISLTKSGAFERARQRGAARLRQQKKSTPPAITA